MRLHRDGFISAALVPFALFLAPGCDKKKQDAAKTGAAPQVAPQAPPGIDKAAAEKALLANLWTGVLRGKPLTLYAVSVKGKLVGVIRHGKDRFGSRIGIDPKGRFAISSRPRPTAKGLETIRFSAQLKGDFSAIAGSAEQSAKQGFVEQSSGLGDFTLAKGRTLQGAPILSPQPPGSFGAAVGLKLWDELIELDGKAIKNGDEIKTPDKVGQEIKLVVLRDGQRVELEGTVPAPKAPPKAPTPKAAE